MSSEPSVAVEVPASSANLGPGFDAFAVALDLRLTVRAVGRGERRVVTCGEGAGELPAGDDNLVWRALTAYCRRRGVAVPDVSLRVGSGIPLERGLGSSAAAAVAGAALARALRADRGRDRDLIDIAAGLEGHADNAAAATLGGLVVCHPGGVQRLDPSPTLRPLLCVPAQRQATGESRVLLPGSVALADAAVNGARASLVLAGLAGAIGWEPAAMRDVLHEPPRFTAMPDTGALVHALRDAGLAACLSGAGPSVLAIVRAGDRSAVGRVRRRLPHGWRLLASAWDRTGAAVRPRLPAPSPPGRR